MRPLVSRAEASGRYVGVDLCRGEALVPEELLDDAQVGPAVEEVGRERMTQRVGRDADRQPGQPPQALQAEAEPADPERFAPVVEEDLDRCREVPITRPEQDRTAFLDPCRQRLA